MTEPAPLADVMGWAKFFEDVVKAARKDQAAEAADSWEAGSKIPVHFAGQRVGWVTVPVVSKYASVTDPAKFLAWARAMHPLQVEEQVTIRATEDVIALVEEHYPDAIVRTFEPYASFVTAVCHEVRDRGGRVNRDTGEVEPVPGVTVSPEGAGTPTVNLLRDKDKVMAAARQAYQLGEMDLPAMLALPAPASVGPDELQPDQVAAVQHLLDFVGHGDHGGWILNTASRRVICTCGEEMLPPAQLAGQATAA